MGRWAGLAAGCKLLQGKEYFRSIQCWKPSARCRLSACRGRLRNLVRGSRPCGRLQLCRGGARASANGSPARSLRIPPAQLLPGFGCWAGAYFLMMVATMMARLRLLAARGDKIVTWDPQRAAAGDPEARAALATAARVFAEARRQGATAFKVEPRRPAQPVERFDPAAEQIVIIPRVAGGAVVPDNLNVITQAGLARLEAELERLRTKQREELAARLREARENPGDQSDNLELLEAQHELSMLEARIAELEYALAQAKVAQAPEGGVAGIGSVVRVRDEDGEEETYTLVGPAEADPRNGLISVASPVGRGLLGARAGDEAVVETPSGPRRLKVLQVS